MARAARLTREYPAHGAALDMLAALKDCSDLLQQLKGDGWITQQCESVLTTAKDAIAKAVGDQK